MSGTSSRTRSFGERSFLYPFMKNHIILFIIFSMAVVACSASPEMHTQPAVLPTSTPFAPGMTNPTMEMFPFDPEQVAKSFLIDVQEAPAQVNSYLSQAMQKKFPGSEVIQILELPGNIDGFVIKSVEANTRNPLAFVTVLLESRSEIFNIRFTLIAERSQWVIDGIDRQQINP